MFICTIVKYNELSQGGGGGRRNQQNQAFLISYTPPGFLKTAFLISYAPVRVAWERFTYRIVTVANPVEWAGKAKIRFQCNTFIM